MSSTIFIRNMVCQRCVRVVNEELLKGGFHPLHVELGEVMLEEDKPDRKQLSKILELNGFELLEKNSARLINELKTFILQFIRDGRLENNRRKFSSIIESQFGKDYGYLSQLFSQAENSTLEKYIIAQKVEQVKEWLAYNELTLSQMAFKLGYSSIAHLSNQFKQLSGFSPSQFRTLKIHERKGLDEV